MREIKQSVNCGADFVQAKPPKAIQTYCTYWCHLAASQGIETAPSLF